MSDRLIKLLLVDDDPIFGLGFRSALEAEEFSDITIVNQVFNFRDALATLAENEVDILVLETDLETNAGFQFAQQILSEYPNLPIFLLTANTDYQYLSAAKQAGFKGYCAKKTPITSIAQGLRRIAKGESYWQALTTRKTTKKIVKKTWLSQQFNSGLNYINHNLESINNQIAREDLPLIDWLFWTGRKREIVLARWLISQFYSNEIIIVQNQISSDNNDEPFPEQLAMISSPSGVLVSSTSLANATLFESTLAKIQSGLDNLTGNFLEIDILSLGTRKELLYVVINQIAIITQENEFLNLKSTEIFAKLDIILRQIWLDSTLIFLRNKYPIEANSQETELVDLIWGEFLFINREIFTKIPDIQELLEYLIIKDTLLIDKINYRYEAPEAKARAEILLENLLVQIANAVMQVILNNFSEKEYIRKIYKVSSSREIAKFRNRISSKYRLQKYWQEPNDIFEDRYSVYYLDGKGIRKDFLEGDRQKELKQLKGLQWLVTIAIEGRDALSPGLRAAVDWIGMMVVYILTEVVGKGLGLIAKGIIQGAGRSLDELRYQKKGKQ